MIAVSIQTLIKASRHGTVAFTAMPHIGAPCVQSWKNINGFLRLVKIESGATIRAN